MEEDVAEDSDGLSKRLIMKQVDVRLVNGKKADRAPLVALQQHCEKMVVWARYCGEQRRENLSRLSGRANAERVGDNNHRVGELDRNKPRRVNGGTVECVPRNAWRRTCFVVRLGYSQDW